jgi:hypothetical protein
LLCYLSVAVLPSLCCFKCNFALLAPQVCGCEEAA